MRRVISLFFMVYLAGCAKREITTYVPVTVRDTVYDTVVIYHTKILTDTVYFMDTAYIDDTATRAERDSLLLQVVALQSAKDSIGRLLFLSNYKVERVRYYLNITLRDRTQDKFLKGWIKRALE